MASMVTISHDLIWVLVSYKLLEQRIFSGFAVMVVGGWKETVSHVRSIEPYDIVLVWVAFGSTAILEIRRKEKGLRKTAGAAPAGFGFSTERDYGTAWALGLL